MKKNLDKLTQNASFCSLAWDHQFMDPTGRVKPCCRFSENERPEEISLNHSRLDQIFYGPWMSDIRKKMLAGERVAGCRRCYQEEDNGKKSLRQRYNDNMMLPIEELVNVDRPRIKWLELAISNACNLACRMCDSRYSWKWFDEEQELFGKTYSKTKVSGIDISNVDPFLDDLVHIKFTGGEPLITKEHWQLIRKLAERPDASEILLNYSTNCTIHPKQEWQELWQRFKLIEFALSFDSADPMESEYIRYPSKFETTEKVTKEFLRMGENPKFNMILRTTVSVLNAWHLPETILWFVKNSNFKPKIINPTHLTHPDFLSITVLPKVLKVQIAQRYQPFIDGWFFNKMEKSLEHIISYMYSKDDTHLLYRLKSYLDKTDSYRGQSFEKSYPQFAGFLDMLGPEDAAYQDRRELDC